MASTDSEQQITVWYDGACPLCLREIAIMRRLDRREAIAFVDVSDEAIGDASCPIDRKELLARFHARGPDGTIKSGAAAFAIMWRAIPLLWPLGQIARIPGAMAGLEWLYIQFLKIRPRLQRLAGGGSS